MVAFAFQNPDPNPAPTPNGTWLASVIVQPNGHKLNGYHWRGRREIEDKTEATAAALAHLKLIELREATGDCPNELARHVALIEANGWD